MGGAEATGQLELPVVDVDGDDRAGAGHARSLDGGDAHAAAADDSHAVASADLAGVDRRAQPGHHATAQQPGCGGVGLGIDLRALPGGDERLLGEGADAERGAQLGAVGQGHLLGGVVGGEAVPGPAPSTGAAFAAHSPPVEDDEVARRHVGDVGTDGLHRARRLVTE